MTDRPQPLPPPDLAARPLPLRWLSSGSFLWRIHSAARAPLWFGPAPGRPPAYRFDDPLGEFRVCYLGTSLEASFAETFLRGPPVRLLALEDLLARVVTRFRTERGVRVVTLHGAGLARAGATAEVGSGPYALSRDWARALREHPSRPDGIEYRARHDDAETSIALFHRAAGALVAEATTPLVEPDTATDLQALGRLLHRYRLGLTR